MGTEDSKPGWLVRTVRRIGRVALWCFVAFSVLWSALALYYSNLPAALRPWIAVSFVIVSVAVLFLIKPRRRGLLAYGCLAAAVLAYWLQIPPSNDRQWRQDVAVLPWVELEGNRVTIHNIRNFDYRSDTEFDVRYYDRTYDVDRLRGVDFFMSFWGPIPFCHTMVSFDFEDGEILCVSIETRPEEHEGYSVIASCFKQFELVYVASDERDVVRLRTNVRDEAVYLYRINTTPEGMRRLFLRYCMRMNQLWLKPEWYFIVSRNCTTDIPRRSGAERGRLPESWKVVINGFVDEFLYDEGSLDQSLPLPDLRKLGHVNTRGQLAGEDPDFSLRIREGIPEIRPGTYSNSKGVIHEPVRIDRPPADPRTGEGAGG